MLTLKRQEDKCPVVANEELPKKPKNTNQGAVRQDARGQAPWQASTGGHRIPSPGLWGPSLSPNSTLNASKPILRAHTAPRGLVPKTTHGRFSGL